MFESFLTITGALFIVLSLLSLVYQFFSASILALMGIVLLNLANNWFAWPWLIWFVILTVIASIGGFLLTYKASQKLPKNKAWWPIATGVLGAICIPIPFVGALIGVFAGTLIALCFFPTTNLNQEKLNLALSITFKSFLGIVLEITCVILMLFSLGFFVVFRGLF